jgi:3-hydroxyisobutyrate dehydrogenase-like beta-hydroxyacid dehydrogenase
MIIETKVTPQSRLGFIGLGYLGSRIARRLDTAGFPMVVYDRDREKTKELATLGAAVAPDVETLAEEADVVLSCLPHDAAVKAVYLGPGKVLESARPGTCIVELSTIAPETSRLVHNAAAKFGLSMLDVAISGSTPAAEAGALTLFGGGECKVFESVQRIFVPIASQWFYMGPSGSGVAMKLVVNTLLGLGMQSSLKRWR